MARNLIILSYDFPPNTGGIARLCQEIAVGMESHFSSVTVLTRKKEGINTPYNFSNVKVMQFSSNRPQCEFGIIKYLRAINNKDDFAILCGVWHPEALLAILGGFNKVYILAHGSEFLSGSSIFRRLFWLPLYGKHILARARKVICNSRYTSSLVKAVSPRSNAIALPLAVNHTFFTPNRKTVQTDTLTICTVSRIEKFKGHDFIAKTIASLPTGAKENIRWRIAGTGPDIDYVKELVSSLNLDGQVEFCGFVADGLLPSFYNEADLFILCSRENNNSVYVEGFGLVFLEAQSCGLPVIGTNTGGIPDAIEHLNGGWLIEQDDLISLSSLLLELHKDKSVVLHMGDLARERVVNRATWELYCRNLYRALV